LVRARLSNHFDERALCLLDGLVSKVVSNCVVASTASPTGRRVASARCIVLFGFCIGPEEQMMLEELGKVYEAYMARTKRLVPGVW
jgi:protein-S-isoprenylcysteine O-methyltransferase Ste14